LLGICDEGSAVNPDEVKRWRRGERERLIALRQALPAEDRRRRGARITAELQRLIAERPGILGIYWPFRAEFDPRPLVDWAVAAQRTIALPVVVDKQGPLEYRAWRPGETLVDGVWNIPVPEKRELVTPTLVLAPLVGFDGAGYRLGYGGGYFDRTLAALAPRAFAIGIGYEVQRLETIHPQPFDVPMDVIVTEMGVHPR
jgi:5-formyltetrahydrofolate cyclo-ligase